MTTIKKLSQKILGRVLVILAVVILGGQGGTRAVSAASDLPAEQSPALPAVQLQISPTTQRFEFNPGENYEGTLELINAGRQEFSYRVYAAPYSVSNDQYDADFNTPTSGTLIVDWIKIATDDGRLAPGEATKIDYLVTVPQDIPAAGQYAAIFVETVPDANAAPTQGVIITQRVAMLLFARLNGETKEEGEVVSQELAGWWWSPPVTTDSVVANTGNIDFEVNYFLRVTDSRGRERLVDQRSVILLPQTQRAVELSWDDDDRGERGEPGLSWADQVPVLGRYQVTQEIEFLGQSKILAKKVWLMPPVLVWCVGIALILAVIGLIVWQFLASQKKLALTKRNKAKGKHD
jgi:hypothetical protein